MISRLLTPTQSILAMAGFLQEWCVRLCANAPGLKADVLIGRFCLMGVDRFVSGRIVGAVAAWKGIRG